MHSPPSLTAKTPLIINNFLIVCFPCSAMPRMGTALPKT